MEPLIKSHVTATVGWALTQTRSEERRVLIAHQRRATKVWSEAEPRPFGLRRNVALAALLGLALLRSSAAPSRLALIPISPATRFMRDLIGGS